MIVVGLTGRIGVGKSTVARMFADRGATVIDADRIAHEVLREPEVAGIVAGRFGPGVVAADGSIDRRRLATRVFGPTATHAADLEALEAIVHPRVEARMKARLDTLAASGALAAAGRSGQAAGDGAGTVVVLDVPLLSKSGCLDRCTHVLEVVCEEPVRRGRLAARGWTPAEIEARDAAWDRSKPSTSPRPGTSAGFLDTSREVRYTQSQVDQVLRELVSR